MCVFFHLLYLKKNTTVLPLGCKQYNTIGCVSLVGGGGFSKGAENEDTHKKWNHTE